MRSALNAGRYADFRESAHALKGSAGSIGAKRLHEACATIERLEDRALKARAAEILHELVDGFEAVRSSLRDYMARQATAGQPARLARGDAGGAARG